MKSLRVRTGWVRQYLEEKGHTGYVGLNLIPPADIVGDIGNWPSLGLKAQSFDYIIAFEVVEHVDCFQPVMTCSSRVDS